MQWAGKQHPVETLVECVAPALLAAALGWSASMMGSSTPAVVVAAMLALAAGWLLLRTVGAAEAAAAGTLKPAVFDLCAVKTEMDELLLDDPLAEGELLLDNPVGDDELLLDDPLVGIEADARVVRLFARQEATPGELVARIADYLGEERQMPSEVAAPAPAPDASAALHAALANIRASLR